MHSFGKRDGSEVYGDFEYKKAILLDQQNGLKIIHFIGLSRPIYNADLTRGISFYVWFKIWTNDICDIIICCAKNNTTTTKTEWTWAAWSEQQGIWTFHIEKSYECSAYLLSLCLQGLQIVGDIFQFFLKVTRFAIPQQEMQEKKGQRRGERQHFEKTGKEAFLAKETPTIMEQWGHSPYLILEPFTAPSTSDSNTLHAWTLFTNHFL